MSRFCLLIVLGLLLSAGGERAFAESPKLPASEAGKDKGANGTSFAKAVVIKEKTESTGVAAEYAWIKKNLPGATTAGQSLVNHEKKVYDIIHVVMPDGKKRDVFFDITGFFGK